MNLLIEFAIKISLVVALGLLSAWLLRRRSAALRHWMLAASMAAALATPLLMRVAPAWRLPVSASVESVDDASGRQPSGRREPRIRITTSVDTESARAASPSAPFATGLILLAIWIVGMVVNLSGLLVG